MYIYIYILYRYYIPRSHASFDLSFWWVKSSKIWGTIWVYWYLHTITLLMMALFSPSPKRFFPLQWIFATSSEPPGMRLTFLKGQTSQNPAERKVFVQRSQQNYGRVKFFKFLVHIQTVDKNSRNSFLDTCFVFFGRSTLAFFPYKPHQSPAWWFLGSIYLLPKNCAKYFLNQSIEIFIWYPIGSMYGIFTYIDPIKINYSCR